jgi:fructose-bisphosphate aldolase class II
MNDILRPAFAQRYGVPAFNIVNDASMLAMLQAADELRSPVILQVSVKTVKYWGAPVIVGLFRSLAERVAVPAALHLDHCPDIAVLKTCIEAGWDSVLYDGSELPYEQCLATTKDVVAYAHARGVSVEGEVEPVTGVEDGVGSDAEGHAIPLDQAVRFIRETGIDSFAPSIGTAHGVYTGKPVINFQRVTEIVAACPTVPQVLHGGTGLDEAVFTDLIARGTAKVNISTQLKITLAESTKAYLDANMAKADPLKQIDAGRKAMVEMAKGYIRIFGSAGKV